MDSTRALNSGTSSSRSRHTGGLGGGAWGSGSPSGGRVGIDAGGMLVTGMYSSATGYRELARGRVVRLPHAHHVDAVLADGVADLL